MMPCGCAREVCRVAPSGTSDGGGAAAPRTSARRATRSWSWGGGVEWSGSGTQRAWSRREETAREDERSASMKFTGILAENKEKTGIQSYGHGSYGRNIHEKMEKETTYLSGKEQQQYEHGDDVKSQEQKGASYNTYRHAEGSCQAGNLVDMC